MAHKASKKQSTLPQPFLCLNCDQTMGLTLQVRLFCSEGCAQEAELVRYVRRCTHDGRIKQSDVIEAIQIRLTHVINGGYPRQERRLSPSKRQEVIGRDGGCCQICGAPGTDIDHINGSSNRIDNLQLLCRACHNEKTFGSFTLIDPDDERYPELSAKEKSFRLRVEAPTPKSYL